MCIFRLSGANKFRIFLQSNARIAGLDKVQQFIGVLADERFQMMAGNVVPLQTVIVEVIQNGQARFVVALRSLTVIGLSLAIAASVTPIARVPLAGRSDFRARSRPEPSVLVGRLQIGTIASGKIALTARRPNVANARSGYALFDEFIFLQGEFNIKMSSLFFMELLITCGVSSETASMQCRRQMLRASSQSTSRLRVGVCSQLKKYEWATPRASRYVE